MNEKPRLISIQFIFVLALTGITLLAPSATKAQFDWYLEGSMSVFNSDDGTAPQSNYETGQVQSTNLLTNTISISGSVANVSATPSASYGLLSLTANCSVDNPSGGLDRGSISSFSWRNAGDNVDFEDWLTITSTTLPKGTPVRIQIACVSAGYITPGTGSNVPYENYTTSTAFVEQDVETPAGVATPMAVFGGDYETNFISTILTNTVGSRFYFHSKLFAQGYAETGGTHAFVGSVSTAITSQSYVNVLTPGADYVADSGTIYPALQLPPPTLHIQAVGSSVDISWPSVYVDYVLEQSSDLSVSAGWEVSGYPITTANGTNSVTLASPAGNLFFRLKQ